ncbi:hypothetical protein ERJ75_001786500 [Trypanosoma vivax]|nr:hypothetical protein ERJ75_001786500 [Trypanosoma vivax]
MAEPRGGFPRGRRMPVTERKWRRPQRRGDDRWRIFVFVRKPHCEGREEAREAEQRGALGDDRSETGSGSSWRGAGNEQDQAAMGCVRGRGAVPPRRNDKAMFRGVRAGEKCGRKCRRLVAGREVEAKGLGAGAFRRQKLEGSNPLREENRPLSVVSTRAPLEEGTRTTKRGAAARTEAWKCLSTTTCGAETKRGSHGMCGL